MAGVTIAVTWSDGDEQHVKSVETDAQGLVRIVMTQCG